MFLAVALNKVTSYYTHTSHNPVKSLARACQTGHATNIIQGFAVGYESTVAALLVIVTAIMLSVLVYWGMPPVFVAYGVAMTGIGMLTLTGNTISMDVFGPVADNANGIGEMGYNRDSNGRELKAGEPGVHAPRRLQAGPANPGRPRRGGQHHQGGNQGHRHRLGRDRRRLALRQLHRRDRRGQRGQARANDRCSSTTTSPASSPWPIPRCSSAC